MHVQKNGTRFTSRYSKNNYVSSNEILQLELDDQTLYNLLTPQGETPIMISPSVMITDYLRSPSLVGCKRWYYITEAGHELTGLPVGHTMDGRTKKMKMETIRPYSQIVRPIYKDLSKTVTIPVTVGQLLEIGCEGITWDKLFDDMFWLKRPCRDENKCETKFIPAKGRLTEQNMNTTLVETC